MVDRPCTTLGDDRHAPDELLPAEPEHGTRHDVPVDAHRLAEPGGGDPLGALDDAVRLDGPAGQPLGQGLGRGDVEDTRAEEDPGRLHRVDGGTERNGHLETAFLPAPIAGQPEEKQDPCRPTCPACGVALALVTREAWKDRATLGQTEGKGGHDTAPVKKVPHVRHNSGEQDWQTPEYLLEAARATLGAIDCDPASSARANERVRARVYFTAETNGLAQVWGPRVWLNPPYQTKLIRAFAEALARKVQSGEVTEAIWLSNNATETEWFASLMPVATAICLLKTRVRFLTPSGTAGRKPLQGQVAIYCGPDVEAFRAAWAPLGNVLVLPKGEPST